jgi:hypothetical protein
MIASDEEEDQVERHVTAFPPKRTCCSAELRYRSALLSADNPSLLSEGRYAGEAFYFLEFQC